MKGKEKGYKTILSVTALVILMVFYIVVLGLLVYFIYEHFTYSFSIETHIVFMIFVFFVMIGYCWLVKMGFRIYSVITITEHGLRSSVLGHFFKIEIAWDKISEIRYYHGLSPSLLISKTIHLRNKSLFIVFKSRDLILLPLNKKVYEMVTKYQEKPIMDLPEDIEAMYSKDK